MAQSSRIPIGNPKGERLSRLEHLLHGVLDRAAGFTLYGRNAFTNPRSVITMIDRVGRLGGVFFPAAHPGPRLSRGVRPVTRRRRMAPHQRKSPDALGIVRWRRIGTVSERTAPLSPKYRGHVQIYRAGCHPDKPIFQRLPARCQAFVIVVDQDPSRAWRATIARSLSRSFLTSRADAARRHRSGSQPPGR